MAVDRLRVVAFTDNGVRTPTPATAEAVDAAVRALVAAGATVERRVPPDTAEAWAAWDGLVRADGWAWLGRLIAGAGTPGMGSYPSRGWLTPSIALSGAELTALVERADAVRARYLRWMTGIDLLVCPAMPQPAIRHGESTAAWFGDTYSDVHNLTGFPAVVVRGGSSHEGLPIGVQLVAPPWHEHAALAGARVVEAASGGWQPPPI